MDWTGIGPTMRPIVEEFICYAFLIDTRPSTISSLVYFVLGRVGLFYVLWICWGRKYFISQIFVPSGYYVCGILLNGLYLFIWDVTFMVSERSFLRSVDLGVRLAFSMSL